MRLPIYMVRHGQHKDNILTPAGVARMMAAAEAIRDDVESEGLPTAAIVLITSQEPRAVMSGAVIAATLGIKVAYGPNPAFNPAQGLGKAIAENRLPQPGKGACLTWRDNKAERVCDGVETWIDVANRAWQGIGFCNTIPGEGNYILVVATHGGVVEPTVDRLEGSDCHDLVEGEVAVIEGRDDQPYVTVRFLNGTLPE